MTTPGELFARPPRGVIPLSKGGDLVINFRQRINATYTAYDPGVSVRLVIDITPEATALATIQGDNAVCKIESNITDTVPAGAAWRCVVSYPTLPSTEIVAMNGTVSRSDS